MSIARDSKPLTETDIARPEGRDSLQGDDQGSGHDDPKAVPAVNQGIKNSENLDKDDRAREDLGKGNRTDTAEQRSLERARRPGGGLMRAAFPHPRGLYTCSGPGNARLRTSSAYGAGVR